MTGKGEYYNFSSFRTGTFGKSSVRSLELHGTVDRSANRHHLWKEVGTDASRVVFGTRHKIAQGENFSREEKEFLSRHAR